MNSFFIRLFYHFQYLFQPPWDTGIPAPELVRAIENLPPGKALDIGCGTGTNLFYLAEHGWEATGIDFVPRAIQSASRKLRNYPSILIVADVTHLENMVLPGPYDLALDMGCYHSLTEEGRRRYAKGLAHWLRTGGLYMLYAWQPAYEGDSHGIPKEAVVGAFTNAFILTNYEQGKGRPSAWYYFERRK